MPNELEAKLKVDDLAPVRDRLHAAGATPAGRRLETNHFFDTPDHTLRQADKGLRVRERRDLETGHVDGFITFKGPQQEGVFKNRVELESAISNAPAMMAILESLGFPKTVSFEKRRESWELLGCHVELDEVPHLGCFVEVEGPTEPLIRTVLAKLNLAGALPVKQSYIALLTEQMPAAKVIRFS